MDAREPATHDRIDEVCDQVIVTNSAFLEHMARMWAGNEVRTYRQQVNGAIVFVLKEYGIDELSAHLYQRGFTAGLNATMNVYRGNVDA